MNNIQIVFLIISIITVLISCFQAWTLFRKTKSDHKDVFAKDAYKKVPLENTANFLKFTDNPVMFIPRDKEAGYMYIDNNLYYRLDPFKKNIVLCGRTTDADIVFLNDVKVSRLHFVLKHNNNLWFIQDLNSSNGTYLNGVWITESTPLKSGDKITVGNEHISVESGISSVITVGL